MTLAVSVIAKTILARSKTNLINIFCSNNSTETSPFLIVKALKPVAKL